MKTLDSSGRVYATADGQAGDHADPAVAWLSPSLMVPEADVSDAAGGSITHRHDPRLVVTATPVRKTKQDYHEYMGGLTLRTRRCVHTLSAKPLWTQMVASQSPGILNEPAYPSHRAHSRTITPS